MTLLTCATISKTFETLMTDAHLVLGWVQTSNAKV